MQVNGVEAKINEFYCYETYGGLLERPGIAEVWKEINTKRISRAREKAQVLWGEWPLIVIPKVVEYSSNLGIEGMMLPRWTCLALLSSSWTNDDDATLSFLGVAWFDDEVGRALNDRIAIAVLEVDWRLNAADWYF